MRDEVSEILRNMLESSTVISAIRRDIVVSKICAAFKKTTAANLDVEELFDEINSMREDIVYSREGMDLDGPQGITENLEFRSEVNAVRDRLNALAEKLALYEYKTKKVYDTTVSHIITDEDTMLLLKPLTVKQKEAVLYTALEEITSAIADIDFIKGRVHATLTECNDKTKSLDAWVNLHKQYMYFFNTRGGEHGQEQKGSWGSEGRESSKRKSEEQQRRFTKRNRA